MNNEPRQPGHSSISAQVRPRSPAAGRVLSILSAAMLAACAAPSVKVVSSDKPLAGDTGTEVAQAEVRVDETAMLPLLGYHQLLQRMSAQELGRERSMLATLVQTPGVRLRQAMVYGQPRAPANLARAQNLLATILKSDEIAASSLHPLARLLADNYAERQKLEQQGGRLGTQIDDLGQQLRDSQRRNAELQQKINALADIERSLPGGTR